MGYTEMTELKKVTAFEKTSEEIIWNAEQRCEIKILKRQ